MEDSSRAETSTGRRADVALAVLIPLGVLGFLALFHHVRHDDAFITFVYARNIASGDGYVFNLGDRVLGATSPLHALLLSLAWPLAGMNVPVVANALSAFALGAQAWLLYVLLRPRVPVTAAVFSLLILCGINDAAQWIALETALAGALVLASFWALQSQRDRMCGVFLGLAFLCRHDAALLVPIVAIQAYLRDRRLPTSVLATSLAVVAPWLLFSQVYFGSVLPKTLGAKWHLIPFADYLSHFLTRSLDYPWRPIRGQLPEALTRTLSAIAWSAGAVFAWRHCRPLLGFFAYAAALLLAYAYIGPFTSQDWHVNVPLIACNLLFVLGIGGWLEARLARSPRPPAFLRSAALGLAASIVVAWAFEAVSFSERSQSEIWWGGRHTRYHGVSEWVNEHVKPGQKFMANEFGTVGFYTRQHMIDTYGLINPTNSFPRTRSGRSYIRLIRRYQPDLILIDTGQIALAAEKELGYWVVKKFDWDSLASAIVVRDPSVLADPAEFSRLRSELPNLNRPPRPLGHEDP